MSWNQWEPEKGVIGRDIFKTPIARCPACGADVSSFPCWRCNKR